MSVLFVIIAAVLLVVISYKPIYDARETSRAVTTWQEGHEEVMTTIPVLGLYFMETMAIGAVAVALATRLPLLANGQRSLDQLPMPPCPSATCLRQL